MNTMDHTFVTADCLAYMRELPDGYADLVFGSPPYEAQRTYGIGFNLQGQAWVDWMVEVVKESLRICKGLVAFVVEGKTRNYRWSATPALLMADLHRAGVNLRKPPIYHRVGIPGSGGPDWLRNDTEWIICATNGGRLPWSDPTATGKPCKYRTGGALSFRTSDGRRINAIKHADGSGKPNNRQQARPTIANPGNVIWDDSDATDGGDLAHCAVGGGRMGSPHAHNNEAPFPEELAAVFIRSFCPPGGLMVDPMSGSGTSVCCAKQCGRRGLGIDCRASQTELGYRRLAETPGTDLAVA